MIEWLDMIELWHRFNSVNNSKSIDMFFHSRFEIAALECNNLCVTSRF